MLKKKKKHIFIREKFRTVATQQKVPTKEKCHVQATLVNATISFRGLKECRESETLHIHSYISTGRKGDCV